MLALFQLLVVSIGVGLGLTNGRGGGHFTPPPVGGGAPAIQSSLWFLNNSA